MYQAEQTRRPVRVLGIGNVLTGDDALGPYVVQTLLAGYEFPPGVEVLDAGTPGLDLTPFLADAEAVIVIDTVASGAPAGTVHRYRRHELLASPPVARTNPHQPGLREALMAAELSDSSPGELLLVGVVPETVSTGTGLSAPVRAVIPEIVKMVVAELDRLGRSPEARSEPSAPDIWWE